MRLLLMGVGTRDPFYKPNPNGRGFRDFYSLKPDEYAEASEGPILSFFRELDPPPSAKDTVHLFPTAGPRAHPPTEQGALILRDELIRRYPGLKRRVKMQTLRDLDPSELSEVLEALQPKVESLAPPAGLTGRQCLVYVSPGTPQMQAAWFTLVHTGRIAAHLVRQLPPHAPESGQIRHVDLRPLVLEDWRRQAMKLFEAGAFEQAAQLFVMFSPPLASPEDSARARAAATLASVYGSWSSFNYPDAAESLQSARAALKGAPHASDLLKIIEDQRRVLEILKAPQPSPMKIVDTFHSARREFSLARYAECLWRCHMVYEQILLMRASQRLQEFSAPLADPGDLDSLAARYPRVRALLDTVFPVARPPFLGPGPAGMILRHLKDRFWSQLESHGAKWLSKTRGDSVHRMIPVSRPTATKGLNTVEGFLRYCLPKERTAIERYPFSANVLQAVAREIGKLV